MALRPRQHLRFVLERWIQRGALYQLLLMLALIGLVAVVGGTLAVAATDAFDDVGKAIWWAFLRLTDPGYLGDDEGGTLRTISTVVTVLGYVLFMGSLIAIMTQWLNQEIKKLESGLTPISVVDHILILGWTNRTPSIVRELVLSRGRVRRFLANRSGGKRLKIVILAESVGSPLRQEIRDLLGRDIRGAHILLRSGSSMRIDHLLRVNYKRAAAIILPAADFNLGGPDVTDTRIVKTLMSISPNDNRPDSERLPIVVAEIFDADKADIAVSAYNGPINVVAGDSFISRLIVQTIRHRGLSTVYSELLSHSHGNEIYIRHEPQLAGRRFSELLELFPSAVPLGLIQENNGEIETSLNPARGTVLTASDKIVVLAREFEDAEPTNGTAPATETSDSVDIEIAPVYTKSRRRILLLGWSHKVSALLAELAGYDSETFNVDILSLVGVDERKSDLKHLDLANSGVQVRHLEGDYTRRSRLEAVAWSEYDSVIFLGSDWMKSSEETDARSILGYSAVRAILAGKSERPGIVVELVDASNAELFKDRPGEVIVSPVVLSHMLAHAALRYELTNVFAEMFGPGGAEIFFRSVVDFGLTDTACTFRDIQRAVASRGAIALGVRKGGPADNIGYRPTLNPGAGRTFNLTSADEIIVLTHYD